jgi:hypothetical protein
MRNGHGRDQGPRSAACTSLTTIDSGSMYAVAQRVPQAIAIPGRPRVPACNVVTRRAASFEVEAAARIDPTEAVGHAGAPSLRRHRRAPVVLPSLRRRSTPRQDEIVVVDHACSLVHEHGQHDGRDRPPRGEHPFELHPSRQLQSSRKNSGRREKRDANGGCGPHGRRVGRHRARGPHHRGAIRRGFAGCAPAGEQLPLLTPADLP